MGGRRGIRKNCSLTNEAWNYCEQYHLNLKLRKSSICKSLDCIEKIYSYVWETRFLSMSSEINAAQKDEEELYACKT